MNLAIYFMRQEKHSEVRTYRDPWAVANGIANRSKVWEETDGKVRDRGEEEGRGMWTDMGMSLKHGVFMLITLAMPAPVQWIYEYSNHGRMKTVWYQQHPSHLQRLTLPMLLLNVQPVRLRDQGYVPDMAPSVKQVSHLVAGL